MKSICGTEVPSEDGKMQQDLTNAMDGWISGYFDELQLYNGFKFSGRVRKSCDKVLRAAGAETKIPKTRKKE